MAGTMPLKVPLMRSDVVTRLTAPVDLLSIFIMIITLIRLKSRMTNNNKNRNSEAISTRKRLRVMGVKTFTKNCQILRSVVGMVHSSLHI